jgi:hypothetical protein
MKTRHLDISRASCYYCGSWNSPSVTFFLHRGRARQFIFVILFLQAF